MSDGLRVFVWPDVYCRRRRTMNMLAQVVQQELKRRIQPVRPPANLVAIAQFVTAPLADIDEK